jgi:hypothetical protein
MNAVLHYLKILTLVFISIVILYILQFVIDVRLAGNLYKWISPLNNWKLILSLVMVLFEFLIALTSFLLFAHFRSRWKWTDGFLLFIAIPALLPIFEQGTHLIDALFLKSCVVIHYFPQGTFLAWLFWIFRWIYAILFTGYIFHYLSKKYVWVWIMELLIFFAYLMAVFTGMIAPLRLGFKL